jgi:hypothetical protein
MSWTLSGPRDMAGSNLETERLVLPTVCTTLHYTTLRCTALCYTLLRRTVQRCTILQCALLYCDVLIYLYVKFSYIEVNDCEGISVPTTYTPVHLTPLSNLHLISAYVSVRMHVLTHRSSVPCLSCSIRWTVSHPMKKSRYL